jgi:protein-S-isoprenylcysteine O-methyltransferase Ste14
VRFPPPILFVLGIGVAWLIGRAVPLPLAPDTLRPVSLLAGYVAIVFASATITWALVTFRLADTGIYPNQPATSIVARGPYRFSRNPMYVGLTALNLGVALVANSLWMVAAIPVVLWLLTVLVIRREEAYLSSAFGETYAEYRRSVRRWL